MFLYILYFGTLCWLNKTAIQLLAVPKFRKSSKPQTIATIATRVPTNYKKTTIWYWHKGTSIKDVRFFLRFWEKPTYLCPMHFILSIYVLYPIFLDIPTYPKIGHPLWMFPFENCSDQLWENNALLIKKKVFKFEAEGWKFAIL